ncbi:MAG: M48 family metalloprotease [Deltaproteobacteria bacterium]|nr:M48 family metalloprotease [Deltaproteobacteria bacterium]
MSGTAPRRVVVFDRIDANRRNTRLMLGIFGLALLPVVGWLSSYLPVWLVLFLPGLMDFMQEARRGFTAYLVLAGAVTPVLLAAALYIQYRYADRLALRMAKARPLERDRERKLRDTVEGLCLGTGLPLPKLHMIETEVPNAFSVGLDPGRSSIAVTRGLVSLLNPREMEGVLAHELSHIGNQDIRLNTTVAAMGAILRLPFRLLTAPFRFLFHVHWLLGAIVLFFVARMFLLSFHFAGGLSSFDELDPTGRLRTLALVQAGAVLYAFFVAPLIGLFFPLAISRQRELLADADAVRLTLDPPSLASALAKIAGAWKGSMRGSHAMANLYIVDPPGAGVWWKGIVSTHPPVGERIELLAGMGDGILPEVINGGVPELKEVPGDVPVPPGEPTLESVISGGEPGVGFLDAALYGIAAGTVAIAVLTVMNCLFLVLGSGNVRTGMITAFQPPAALAAGFSARKRGASGIITLGFAIFAFLFSWIFFAPLLPLMPDSTQEPLRWILWSLFSDFVVVVMAATAGASLDRWAGWVKAFFEKLLKPSR